MLNVLKTCDKFLLVCVVLSVLMAVYSFFLSAQAIKERDREIDQLRLEMATTQKEVEIYRTLLGGSLARPDEPGSRSNQ